MSTNLIILVILIISIIILFIALHLRPLKQGEIENLANKRRKKAVDNYFAFSNYEAKVNIDFKKHMAADGAFYNTSENLFSFPSSAAGLLKYKKHEWITIALEKNQQIKLFWVNKGVDNWRAHLGIDCNHIREIAIKGRCDTVLCFHNHPNPDPSRYYASKPSNLDVETAELLADQLLVMGINLLEFVCERGKSHEYWRSISDHSCH